MTHAPPRSERLQARLDLGLEELWATQGQLEAAGVLQTALQVCVCVCVCVGGGQLGEGSFRSGMGGGGAWQCVKVCVCMCMCVCEHGRVCVLGVAGTRLCVYVCVHHWPEPVPTFLLSHPPLQERVPALQMGM